jgi:serine phosphatase RsbU (regulator of sigma subunit)/AcrR family transcriptional regulator
MAGPVWRQDWVKSDKAPDKWDALGGACDPSVPGSLRGGSRTMTADPPPNAPRRAKRADATRNRTAVLAAAAKALSRGDELNMHAVADAAELSRSTLYRHFPTRDSLEAALRDDAIAAIEQIVDVASSDRRPPLAVVRDLVRALVELGRKRRTDLLALPRPRVNKTAAGLHLVLERVRQAADISPPPPAEWMQAATGHFVQECLTAGAGAETRVRAVANDLFHSLTERLDQGLLLLDPTGSLLGINEQAAQMLVADGRTAVGKTLTEPRFDIVYEDGSPCPGNGYPLAQAVATQRRHSGVRGHRVADGTIAWVAIDARPLVRPDESEPYGVLGVLSDATAEKDWQLARLRPAGELGVPLDIARTLEEIPPALFPEQFVSEARRINGGPVALYVVDIDGTHLLRLAGPEEFPDHIDAPLALGPELAEDGIPELKARLEAELPGATMAPMWLRGRALGLLLARQGDADQLLELGRHGAAAMELANGYTDVIDAARRRKETHAAAELQQSLVPPRIARVGGGELAGSVLPSYEVGGDWFDYVENPDGTWIAIADAVGKGATAGALGGIALAALRAARRSDQSFEEAAQTMHEVICDVARPEFFVTAIIARWNALYSVFSWINCGHPPPLILHPDDTIEQLSRQPALPLGLFDRERKFVRHQRRLNDEERLILHSDGITARKTPDGLFGLDGIERAVRGAASRSATAIAKAIQESVMSATDDPLQDDAVAIVFAPTAPRPN